MLRRWLSLSSSVLIFACFDPAPTTTGTDADTGTTEATSASTTGVSTSVSASATTASSSTTTDDSTTDETAGTSTGPSSSSSSSSDGRSSDTTAALVPEIEVSIGGSVIASGDDHPITDTVDVGVTGSETTVTIENVGTGQLQITGVLAAGDADAFEIDQGALAMSLGPSEQSTFTVAFAPDVGGLATFTATIGSDDADEGAFEIVFTAHTTSDAFRQVMPAASPSARFNSAMAALPDGRLVLYGGRDGTGATLDDTWIFDPQAETWTDVMPPSAPPARFAHEMAYAGDDTIVLYGGTPGPAGPAFDDTWIFDAVTEQWDQLMIASPGTRFQHGMVELGGSSVMAVGGRPGPSFSAELADTWIFDAVAETWTNVNPVAAVAARSVFALGYDGDDTVTLYGGFNATIPSADTYNYSIAANTWTLATPDGNPGARGVLQGDVLLDGRMVVWSGKLDNCCVNPTGGTFAYDPEGDSWEVLAPAVEPTPRFNYSMATIPGRNRAIIFGGLLENTGVGTAQDQTWEYVGESPL